MRGRRTRGAAIVRRGRKKKKNMRESTSRKESTRMMSLLDRNETESREGCASGEKHPFGRIEKRTYWLDRGVPQ